MLTDWINDVLVEERIIVKQLEEDLYDGQVLQKLLGESAGSVAPPRPPPQHPAKGHSAGQPRGWTRVCAWHHWSRDLRAVVKATALSPRLPGGAPRALGFRCLSSRGPSRAPSRRAAASRTICGCGAVGPVAPSGREGRGGAGQSPAGILWLGCGVQTDGGQLSSRLWPGDCHGPSRTHGRGARCSAGLV